MWKLEDRSWSVFWSRHHSFIIYCRFSIDFDSKPNAQKFVWYFIFYSSIRNSPDTFILFHFYSGLLNADLSKCFASYAKCINNIQAFHIRLVLNYVILFSLRFSFNPLGLTLARQNFSRVNLTGFFAHYNRKHLIYMREFRFHSE